MKNRKVTKILAAVLTGAMLMATPSVAMAESLISTQSFVVNAAVPAVQNLAVTYEKGEGYLTWTPVQLTDNQQIIIEFSSSPAFPDTDATSFTYAGDSEASRGKFKIEDNVIRAGLANYYRVLIVDYSLEQIVNYNTLYGVSYSGVVSYTPDLGKVGIAESSAAKKSVYFRFNLGEFTGVEISRAEGSKKYEKVAVTTDAEYTDKNLKSETTYRYRLRGYVLDQAT